jgi:hypothetical protein
MIFCFQALIPAIPFAGINRAWLKDEESPSEREKKNFTDNEY